MANRQTPPSPPEHDQRPDDNKLPQRWAIILLVGGAAGFVAEAAAGPAAGITVTVLVIGLMHTVLA